MFESLRVLKQYMLQYNGAVFVHALPAYIPVYMWFFLNKPYK